MDFNKIKLTAEIVFRNRKGAFVDFKDPYLQNANLFKAWHEGTIWRDIDLELEGATWEDLGAYVRSVSCSSNPTSFFELLENLCIPIQACVLALDEKLNLMHRMLAGCNIPPEGVPVINLRDGMQDQVVWTTNGLADGTVVEAHIPANKLYPYAYTVDSTYLLDKAELFGEEISLKEFFYRAVLHLLKVATKDNAALCFMLDQAAESQGHRYAADHLSSAISAHLRDTIERQKLPAPHMLVTPKAMVGLVEDPDQTRFLDLVTKKELFSSGVVGRWSGVELICVGSNYDSFVEYSSHSEIMVCTAPAALGVRQVRVPLMVHPVILPPPTTQKTPPEKIGWYAYQVVTTSILQSRGVATFTKMGK